MTMKEAAIAYWVAGFHPVPAARAVLGNKDSGKRPLVEWKAYIDAKPKPEEIEQWWTQYPEANIAIPMGHGVFALDIDGEDGFKALAEAGFTLPTDWPYVQTGHGRHYYLKGDVRNKVGVLKKVDTRGYGGYVIAPPSMHYEGKRYEWVPQMPADWPEAPQALLDILAGPQVATQVQREGTTPEWANLLTGVAEGSRNVTAARLVGHYWGLGSSVEEIESLMSLWNGNLKDPLPQKELDTVIRSITSREGGPRDARSEEAPPAPETKDVRTLVSEALRDMFLSPTDRRCVATYFSGIDRRLAGGLEPGELALVGASPGTGKTALVLQIARENAKRGKPVVVVTREMKASRIVRRLLVQMTGVSLADVRKGNVIEADKYLLQKAGERLAEWPIDIWETRHVDTLAMQIRNLQVKPALIVVDYLQLMMGAGESKRAQVEAVCAGLKNIATEHDIPIICVSALRRIQKKKDGTKPPPNADDLRESGELEFTADIIVLLDREFGANVCDVVLAKAREGEVGSFQLMYDGPTLTFRDTHQ